MTSKESKSNLLPFQLTAIQINNYQGIIDLKINNIPKNTAWIFLTGENSFGKTTILKAIAKGLIGEEDLVESLDSHSKIRLSGVAQSQTFRQEIVAKRKASVEIPLAAYGVSRLQLAGISQDVVERSKQKTYSLFKEHSPLINIELELIKNYAYNPLFFKELVSVLKKIIPHLSDIAIETVKGNPQVRYTETDETGNSYPHIALDQLAAGYRSVLTMIGDMMVRLYNYDTNAIEGIVLIDEIDAHLHPKYQYELPRLLSELFPKVQFIATTHSPIPLLSLRKGQFIVLTVSREVEKGIQVERKDERIEIYRLNPNALLTSPIFGFHHLFAAGATADEITPVEDYNEVEKMDRIKKRLQRLREQGLIQ